MKAKALFLLLFIVLLPITSYIYGIVYYHLIPWKTNDITTILTVLIYLAAILPLTAYLSDKLVKFYLKKSKQV